MKATTRKILKVAGILILSLAALLLFTAIYLASINSRKPSFDDSKLTYTHPDIPMESNAFYTLLKATNEIYWPQAKERALSNLAANTNWDDSLAAEILQKNSASLNSFDKAVQQPFFLVPELQHFEDDDPYYLGAWRNLAQIESIQINSLHRAHQDKEALASAFEIIDFGQRIENSGGPILYYLVGESIKTMGLWHIQKMIPDINLDEADLIDAIHKLNDLGPNKEGFTNVMKVEYRMQKSSIDDVAQGTVPGLTNSTHARSLGSKLVFNPDKTKWEFAECDQSVLDDFSKPFSEATLKNIDFATNAPVLEHLIRGNIAGDILFLMAEPTLQPAVQRKSREDVTVRATQILLALKAYKMQHGQLPDSLSELVPKFFPHVPLDDFDGQPFRYSPAEKIIYSVGPCLKDLDGKERENESPDYNLPFQIKF